MERDTERRTVGAGRRAVIRAIGVASLPLLAGCVGGEDDDAADADDADDVADADDDAGEDASDDAPDVRPSEIDLEPDDAWDDDHPDIEIPDEPGRAVLVLGDDRYEMEGDFSGGPREEMYNIVQEGDEFEGDGVYFLMDGIFQVTDESKAEYGLEEDGYNVRFFRRMVGWSGNEFSYLNSDEIEIWWPGLMEMMKYVYREAADGSAEVRDSPITTYGEEPFLRIDRSGVLTATGTIEDPGESELPAGTAFEFGARADEGWMDRREAER
ncbi:hypothetical protein QA600_06805 [Natronococcus sp. A-GB1]|uniref:hypothetical protein n=1 Tax=Natronococcus sp. A-GB1 TaxID=3037648 RepID=UPI00241BF9DB|nr:hypothetical protein [Natronococcus sp. A-GB1]MDG5759047.1 hypothetical protein [Natronococcus sp. A-GB1]